ncbi:uncharacterized protein B0T23DRAFT_318486 [Neurospora hispaniola]|uniref:NWD NACHT-NTPase N-terminal domain-containing protein n=1 Tax=Neurospora hispaniola TaxID=588809 RepID=A0AAJ0MQU8_9PEZI|nr:hypothetical protein B0T23DRAFT_318486 [Neurospora hispaniola]
MSWEERYSVCVRSKDSLPSREHVLRNISSLGRPNREGFTYTIHKMQYYSALEPLFPLRGNPLNLHLEVVMEVYFEIIYNVLPKVQSRTVLRGYEHTAKTFVKETFKLKTWKELRANNEKAKAPQNQGLELLVWARNASSPDE